MKTYKKLISKPREYTAIDTLVCDICKDKAERPDNDWAGNSGFRKNKVTVKWVAGNIYPEGDFSKTEAFDICPDCWTDKLVPWMATFGAFPTKKNTEDYDD